MNELLNLFGKVKFWQLMFIVSVVLLTLGFTGSAIWLDLQVLEGKETTAIYGGYGTLLASVVLRFIPAPERKDAARHRAAVTPIQASLASKFPQWTKFDAAVQVHTPDHKLSIADLRIKNTELRLKLAALQGILRWRMNSDGEHEVRYRYNKDDLA